MATHRISNRYTHRRVQRDCDCVTKIFVFLPKNALMRSHNVDAFCVCTRCAPFKAKCNTMIFNIYTLSQCIAHDTFTFLLFCRRAAKRYIHILEVENLFSFFAHHLIAVQQLILYALFPLKNLKHSFFSSLLITRD